MSSLIPDSHGSTDLYFRALARDLGRAVYAVDLRNHGDSPHDLHHDYVTMAEDVAGFIDEHELTDTSLIGHSMSVIPETL